jgi:hypothetical protein
MAGITYQEIYFPSETLESKGPHDDPELYCGMVWSGTERPGDDINGTSRLSQAFRVWPGDGLLTLKYKFISDEYRRQIGWPVDFFSIKLHSEDGKEEILAEGSVKTLPYEPGSLPPGWVPASGIQEIKIPMKDYWEKGVVLTVESTNRNDSFPSNLVVDDFKIEKDPQWIKLGAGFWSMPASFNVLAGKAVKFKIKNPNPMVGTTIRVVPNNNLGKSKESMIPATTTIEWIFYNQGPEPRNWHFDVRTTSNMNNLVTWEAWSNWVPEIIE